MKLIVKMCLASLAGLLATAGEVTAGTDAPRLPTVTEGVPAINNRPVGAPEGEFGGGIMKSAPIAAPATNVSDNAITMKVREQLLASGLRSGRMRVSTDNGIVQLNGKAQSDTEKLTALNAVRTVEGVQSVVDGLEVEK